MSRVFSLRMFSLGFGVTYALAIIYNWPAFCYYPLVQRLSLTDLPDKTLGPVMYWYGWMATSVISGVVASVAITLTVPRRLIDRLWPAFYWLIPVVMLFGACIREQDWFLK